MTRRSPISTKRSNSIPNSPWLTAVEAMSGEGWRQYDMAIADLTTAIKLAPQDAKHFFERGICWQEKGEITKAVADYNEAVHLDPAYTDAAYDKVARVIAKKRRAENLRISAAPLPPGTRDVSAYFKGDDVLSGAGTSISIGPARADLLSIEALGIVARAGRTDVRFSAGRSVRRQGNDRRLQTRRPLVDCLSCVVQGGL